MNRERGFSLIELLISITLVAALSAGLLTALRNGLMTMERTQRRLFENRTALGIQDVIRRQIGGAIPARGYCGSTEGAGTDVFRGNPDAMLLVSNESMVEGSRGLPRVALYRVIPNADRTVRLEVFEALFSGPAGSAPFCGPNPRQIVVPNAVPFVLFDRLAYCRFSYRMLNFNTLLGREWMPEWVQPFLPQTVRIEMQAAPGNSTRMPIGSITIPLFVSRAPGEVYVEE